MRVSVDVLQELGVVIWAWSEEAAVDKAAFGIFSIEAEKLKREIDREVQRKLRKLS